MRLTSRVAILLLALLDCASVVHAQSPNMTVTVTGSGPSIDDAKIDAIRQALQLTVKQLVVVDRAISGDKILRDKVMSTMNGYVERFYPTNMRRVSSGFAIDAEVTISASRIENFIGITTGGGGAFSGGRLLEEQRRRAAQLDAEQLQVKARGEILDRLLRDFPSVAAQVKITQINLSPRDHNKLILDFEYSYKPTFITALQDTARVLSVGECSGPPSNVDVPGCPKTPARLCFSETSIMKCYALPAGDYCRRCKDLTVFKTGVKSGIANNYELVIVGRFIDSVGRSATRGKQLAISTVGGDRIELNDRCLYLRTNVKDVGASFMYASSIFVHGIGYQDIFFGGINTFRNYRGIAEVDGSLVDLARAEYFVGVPILAIDYLASSEPAAFVAGLGSRSDARSSANVCELLDEVVQRHLLSSQTKPETAARLVAPQRSSTDKMPSVSTTLGKRWRTEVGSVLALEESAEEIIIRYEEVRGLAAQFGIGPGAVIFRGERAGNQLKGTATAYFSNGCQPTYMMNITIRDAGNTLVTESDAPLRIDESCRILETSSRSFTFVRLN